MGEQCIFMAPPARFVPQLMNELFAWMKGAHENVHPFADGNGRMARLWHTAILSKWKPIFEYNPIESQIYQKAT